MRLAAGCTVQVRGTFPRSSRLRDGREAPQYKSVTIDSLATRVLWRPRMLARDVIRGVQAMFMEVRPGVTTHGTSDLITSRCGRVVMSCHELP